jgi:hypothetical protein
MKIQKSGELDFHSKRNGEVEKHNCGGLFASFLRYFWLGNCHRRKNIKPVVGMNAAEAMKFAVSGGVAGFHSDKNVFKAPE